MKRHTNCWTAFRSSAGSAFTCSGVRLNTDISIAYELWSAHQHYELRFIEYVSLLVDPEECLLVLEEQAPVVEEELEELAAAAVFRKMVVADACSWVAAFVAGVADTCLVEDAWEC